MKELFLFLFFPMIGAAAAFLGARPAHAETARDHTAMHEAVRRPYPLAGAYNCRDLGGIETKDGAVIRRGKLIRSDGLDGLTAADLACLAHVPVKTVVDLRSSSEQAKAPDRLPTSATRAVLLPIEPGNLAGFSREDLFNPAKSEELMTNLYRLLVTDPSITEQYRKLFTLLQNESQLPLLFHCSAGKDRTGLAAALILYTLGVDNETIMRDYMASARNLKGKYASNDGVYSVKREYLEAAFEAIVENYGSVSAYLVDILHVDVKTMREIYLEG